MSDSNLFNSPNVFDEFIADEELEIMGFPDFTNAQFDGLPGADVESPDIRNESATSDVNVITQSTDLASGNGSNAPAETPTAAVATEEHDGIDGGRIVERGIEKLNRTKRNNTRKAARSNSANVDVKSFEPSEQPPRKRVKASKSQCTAPKTAITTRSSSSQGFGSFQNSAPAALTPFNVPTSTPSRPVVLAPALAPGPTLTAAPTPLAALITATTLASTMAPVSAPLDESAMASTRAFATAPVPMTTGMTTLAPGPMPYSLISHGSSTTFQSVSDSLPAQAPGIRPMTRQPGSLVAGSWNAVGTSQHNSRLATGLAPQFTTQATSRQARNFTNAGHGDLTARNIASATHRIQQGAYTWQTNPVPPRNNTRPTLGAHNSSRLVLPRVEADGSDAPVEIDSQVVNNGHMGDVVARENVNACLTNTIGGTVDSVTVYPGRGFVLLNSGEVGRLEFL